METEEDTFLLTREDRLKAEISNLQQRLTKAREEKERLQRELLEEKIAHIVASRFSEEIKDFTRHKASEMKDVQQEIFEKLMAATSARCVQEMIGYYRLCGRTTFTFQERYTGIRLETFYKGTYHEPYYLLLKADPLDNSKVKIAKHTVPHFIPIDRLEEELMPHNQEALLRILQDFLLAYVSRREQVKELEELAESRPSLLSVNAPHHAKNRVFFVQALDDDRRVKNSLHGEH